MRPAQSRHFVQSLPHARFSLRLGRARISNTAAVPEGLNIKSLEDVHKNLSILREHTTFKTWKTDHALTMKVLREMKTNGIKPTLETYKLTTQIYEATWPERKAVIDADISSRDRVTELIREMETKFTDEPPSVMDSPMSVVEDPEFEKYSAEYFGQK